MRSMRTSARKNNGEHQSSLREHFIKREKGKEEVKGAKGRFYDGKIMDSSLLSTIPDAKRNFPKRYPLRFRIVGRSSVDLSRNVVTTTKGQQGVASIYPTGLHLLPRAISFSGNLHLATIESSVQLFSFVQFPFDPFHAFRFSMVTRRMRDST